MRILLELSGRTYGVMYLSLQILLVSGIIPGFIRSWWKFGWIWLSLALLVAIVIGMSIYGSSVYSGVQKAIGLPYHERGKEQPAVEPACDEVIEKLRKRDNRNYWSSSVTAVLP